MILIYTPKITNRVKYIFKLIFKELLDVDFLITSSIEEFQEYQDVKINYSQQAIDNEIFLSAHAFLFETGIKEQYLSFIDFEDTKAFFPNYNEKSALPFDPFAASFYLVSRYEEYLPFMEDSFGRFEAKESIAYKEGFLQKPLVNIWAIKIADIIKQKYPSFQFPAKQYRFIPTFDVDIAYSYKGKGLARSVGGCLKSIATLDFQEINERIRVLAGMQKDPYDTFEFQFNIQEQYNLKPLYFILFGDYGQYDKNINIRNKSFQSLIKSIGDYAEVGIHPSFASSLDSRKLKIEIKQLSEVLNREISKSRQHFLKLKLPDTYRDLINSDVTDDYTMGYASEIGFRASICSPFYFYDLDYEAKTNLRVNPLIMMEGALVNYKNVSADDALQYIKPVIEEIKAVNGNFISLWHNQSLSNTEQYIGWNKVYEEMVKIAI